MSKISDAKFALGFPVSALRTYVGTDANPSPILAHLMTIKGSDPDAWELSQDGAAFLADVGQAVIDNMTNQAAIPLAVIGVIVLHFPELKGDIEELRKP